MVCINEVVPGEPEDRGPVRIAGNVGGDKTNVQTADLGGERLLAAKASEVTSPPTTDTKNSRSSADRGIGNMMRRVIGKFNHDSGHRTTIVPTLINGAAT
ncbi:hypothetical protein QTP88_025964 [Uroleucon formosanum]